jgi:hypothetical protein
MKLGMLQNISQCHTARKDQGQNIDLCHQCRHLFSLLLHIQIPCGIDLISLHTVFHGQTFNWVLSQSLIFLEK